MQETAQVSPVVIFQTLNLFQHSAALKAGIELEIFTHIAEGRTTASEIAAASGAAERGIAILCDSLTVMGFLTKTGENYGLRDDAAFFLDKNSPGYMGGAIDFLLSPMTVKGFQNLTEAVRRGGTALEAGHAVEAENPAWVSFARGMMPLMMMPAQIIAGSLGFEKDHSFKVLDIAAGHGIFGITIAKEFPAAEIYALDWPNVLEVARESAEKFGVADRYQTIAGSAFDADFGEGFEVILLTNFLHHFDVPTCETILRKINGSLADGGKLITLEFVPNDDRVSPPVEAMFSLIMLSNTPGGQAYTFAELDQMLKNAGFSHNELQPLAPMPQYLIVSGR